MSNILITGGAGFIGANSAEQFIKDDWDVKIFDNLSRKGSNLNLEYLQKKYPGKFEFLQGDVQIDSPELYKCAAGSDVILHLAGQVAVTTSVTNPREDFDVNALGTFNVLESARKAGHKPLVIYSSTNKVYGGMEDIKIIEQDGRYVYQDYPQGIDEKRLLDFHSPYGCSKGAADQYVRDYFRIYGLPTVVFRQSCIYGPNQFGVEDQGWVAWFTIATLLGKPLTIYGNGKQVRDVLHIQDLIRAYKIATEHPDKVKGKIFNIGGGPKFTMSLLELIKYLEEMLGVQIKPKFSDWRPGDQPVYISNIEKAQRELSWKPQINPKEGVQSLVTWVKENKELLLKYFS